MPKPWKLALATLTLAALPIDAQSLPKDVSRSLDSFTGDTIWETKYGRLDDPQGCSRENIAVVWRLTGGPQGRAEFVRYEWIAVDAPFSPPATWLGGVAAILNLDGDFLEAEAAALPPRLGGGGKEKTENASFRLPPGTLERVAQATNGKIRFVGTERTCDGTIEKNMITRLRSLLEHVS